MQVIKGMEHGATRDALIQSYADALKTVWIVMGSEYGCGAGDGARVQKWGKSRGRREEGRAVVINMSLLQKVCLESVLLAAQEA